MPKYNSDLDIESEAISKQALALPEVVRLAKIKDAAYKYWQNNANTQSEQRYLNTYKTYFAAYQTEVNRLLKDEGEVTVIKVTLPKETAITKRESSLPYKGPITQCVADINCKKKVYTKSMCCSHYNYARRYPNGKPVRLPCPRICKSGCGGIHHANGFCLPCYKRDYYQRISAGRPQSPKLLHPSICVTPNCGKKWYSGNYCRACYRDQLCNR